jgi:S1-C subfamily serine protease
MSTAEDWPAEAGSASIAEDSPPPAGSPRPRVRLLAITAAAALVAGAGTAWAATAGGGAAAILTTSQIVAKTNPGVVDVVSTLGYQGATAAGTGIVLTQSGEVLTNNHVIDGATAIKVGDAATAASHGLGSGLRRCSRHRGAARTGRRADDGGPWQLLAVKAGQKVVAIGNADGKGGTVGRDRPGHRPGPVDHGWRRVVR